MKWENWGPAHNAWYKVQDLHKAEEFIAKHDKKYGFRTQKEYQKQRVREHQKQGDV